MKFSNLACCGLSVLSMWLLLTLTSYAEQKMPPLEHEKWLKDKFSRQHEDLLPIVAVADMFSACNYERKTDPVNYQVKDLVTKMDRQLLAEKLALCLGEDSLQSDIALNFGLIGCFREQLSELPKEERQQKLALVKRAIASLSREERHKSLTKCVSDQAIKYLN